MRACIKSGVSEHTGISGVGWVEWFALVPFCRVFVEFNRVRVAFSVRICRVLGLLVGLHRCWLLLLWLWTLMMTMDDDVEIARASYCSWNECSALLLLGLRLSFMNS